MNMKPRIVQQLKAIENEVTKLIGHPVCLSSPKQVSAVLYDELNLQIEGMKTHSTAEKILKVYHNLYYKTLASCSSTSTTKSSYSTSKNLKVIRV